MGDIHEGSTIAFFQSGKPGVADVQTKLAANDRVVLILRNSDTDHVYFAKDGENSVFYINDKNQILSQSDQMICARYDGLPFDILVNDLQATKRFKEMTNDK